MKKTLLILLASTILFAACKHDEPAAPKTTVTVNTHTDGNVYLVKINTSSTKTITASNTGKVESTKSRAAADELHALPQLHDDAFIRQQNQKIVDALANTNISRAADDEIDLFHIETGYSNVTYEIGDKRTFHTFSEGIENGNMLEGISHEINATCYYVGEHCFVFGDDTELNNAKSENGINLNYDSYAEDAQTSDNSFFKLGKEFDRCYDLETEIIGDPKYNKYRDGIFVPCNQKVIIFVSDLYGDATKEQKSGVVGLFVNGDLFNQEFLDNYVNITMTGKKKSPTDTSYVHTNAAAMFYVDSNFLTNMETTVYTTLVHEFNHMINFIQKTLKYMNNDELPTVNDMANHMCDTWFTEMLAMTTEDMFCSFLNTKLEDSPMARLAIFDLYYHYGFRNWGAYTVSENSQLDSIYISYANTYAFGAFLARNYGGTDLIKEIATSQYVNEQAIDKALKARGSSYKEALANFALVIINTSAPNQTQLAQTGDNYYYTLNRSAKKTGEQLYFEPIQIYNLRLEDYNYTPAIYRRGSSVDLGPNAFSVHYVGNNIKSFELTANTSSLMEYYLVEFN